MLQAPQNSCHGNRRKHVLGSGTLPTMDSGGFSICPQPPAFPTPQPNFRFHKLGAPSPVSQRTLGDDVCMPRHLPSSQPTPSLVLIPLHSVEITSTLLCIPSCPGISPRSFGAANLGSSTDHYSPAPFVLDPTLYLPWATGGKAAMASKWSEPGASANHWLPK